MYHIWKMNERRNTLQFVKSRPHKGYCGTIPAAWQTRTAANKWAQAHPDCLPHGYMVRACDGPDCDMGDHGAGL